LSIKNETPEGGPTSYGAIEGTVSIAFEKWGIDAAARDVRVYTIVPTQSGSNDWRTNNWMSGIKDETLMRNLSIPGTHDSATKGVRDITAHWARTQSLTISEQLELGVRYLDIRVNENGNIFHGSGIYACYTGMSFADVVSYCIFFLAANPSETILMSIQDETTNNTGGQKASAVSHIKSKMDSTSSWWIYTNTPSGDYSSTDGENFKTMTLGAARGKIIAVSSCTGLGRGIGFNDHNAVKYQNEWTAPAVDKYVHILMFLIQSFVGNYLSDGDEYTQPLLLNGWNREAQLAPWGWSAYDYAMYIEQFFYGKVDLLENSVYYPRGVQIMDFYNVGIGVWIMYSNYVRGYGK